VYRSRATASTSSFEQRRETTGVPFTHTPQVAPEVPAFDKVAEHRLIEADGAEVCLKPEGQEVIDLRRRQHHVAQA